MKCRGLCILHCLSVEAKDFWYIYVFMYGCYCKYHNEICYKSPISGMVVIFLCLSCLFFFQKVHCKYCIELSYKDPWVVCFGF